jgi:hypothetical protein
MKPLLSFVAYLKNVSAADYTTKTPSWQDGRRRYDGRIHRMTLSFDSQNGLVVTLTVLEKILSFRGDFRITSERVKSAWRGMPKSSWKELRMPGSFVPGIIKAGTYLTPRGKEFWYVTRKKRHAITIELDGCKRYQRLVLGVEQPESIDATGLKFGSPPAGLDTESEQ